jgi:hypothetical protein
VAQAGLELPIDATISSGEGALRFEKLQADLANFGADIAPCMARSRRSRR